MTVPASISSLFSSIDLMYLFTNFVVCGVVGHIRVLNFWSFVKSLKPGNKADILIIKPLRMFLNLSHDIIKCCSESMGFSATVILFVVVWQ